MVRPSARLIATLILAAQAAAPRDACAQGQETFPTPYRATFGGAWTDPTYRQALEMSASILRGFDQDYQANTSGLAPTFRAHGQYTGLLAAVDFQSRGDAVQWRAGAGSNLRYYSDLQDALTGSHYQAAGVTVRLAGRTTVTVNETAAYAPSFIYDMFPTGPAPALTAPITPITAAADYSLATTRFYTLDTHADVTTNVSRRASISARGGVQRTAPVDGASSVFATDAADIGAGFSYGLSRSATLRIGYQTRDVTLPSRLRLRERNIDFGIDYHRALSRSRRTTLAVTTSTTSFTGPVFNGPPNTFAQQTAFAVDAALNHRFGRTWNLTGVYHRGVNVIEGLEVPLFTDGVTTTVAGFLSRRADVNVTGAYSLGNSILVASQSRLTTATANARFRYALNRRFATFAEYVFYYYDFDRTLQLPAGVSPRMERNSIRVGLTVWARPWVRH